MDSKELLPVRSTITMRYPTAWHGDMWREGAPCGNGVVGALVYGGTGEERILLNHTKPVAGRKSGGYAGCQRCTCGCAAEAGR